MNKYLVTGAAGFIGARVARMLLERGDAVVGLDNMNDYYDVRLKEHRLDGLRKSPDFYFYPADIEDGEAVAKVFGEHGFRAVYNLAARAGVRYSLENPRVYMTTNAMGTLNLLEAMRRHDVKKMVLASTSSLYAGQPMPFEENLPVNEPVSPYAASKKAAEAMAYTYHYLYGMDVTVARYFTVYGPAGRPDMAPFRFIEWIERGRPLTLYGDGSQSRDFTYVDDIARGTLLAEKLPGCEIINLGGNRPVVLRDFISMIEKLLGKKAVIEQKPFHKADLKETWADITKARRLLGWQPEVTLEEGLRQTVQWHRTTLRQLH